MDYTSNGIGNLILDLINFVAARLVFFKLKKVRGFYRKVRRIGGSRPPTILYPLIWSSTSSFSTDVFLRTVIFLLFQETQTVHYCSEFFWFSGCIGTLNILFEIFFFSKTPEEVKKKKNSVSSYSNKCAWFLYYLIKCIRIHRVLITCFICLKKGCICYSCYSLWSSVLKVIILKYIFTQSENFSWLLFIFLMTQLRCKFQLLIRVPLVWSNREQ